MSSVDSSLFSDLKSQSGELPRYEREPSTSTPKKKRLRSRSLFKIIALVATLSFGFTNAVDFFSAVPTTPASPFAHLAGHCAGVAPIESAEFITRQRNLVRIMRRLNVAAYIAEPGSNALYFANISSAHWHLSERPFLVLITPASLPSESSRGHDSDAANVTILAPRFELLRAQGLEVPYDSATGLNYIDWAEDENPFEVLKKDLPAAAESGTVVVDEGLRKFVADGLNASGIHIRPGGYPAEVATLREQKSEAELDLLRCANEATVLAIRAVKAQLTPPRSPWGNIIRESYVSGLLSTALSEAGLTDGGGLVLFGENAALPHGSGTDRVLKSGDFILIDCGGKLHGYESDITRTFTISPAEEIPARHLELWYTVHAAQRAALSAARLGAHAREVDAVARKVVQSGIRVSLAETRVDDAGGAELVLWQGDVNDVFTHRLGHGIGLDGHESPYLRGGSDNTHILATNNTFSNEPGIYIPGDVGIRLEDCFYVSSKSGPDGGRAVLFTEGVGGLSQSPWAP